MPHRGVSSPADRDSLARKAFGLLALATARPHERGDLSPAPLRRRVLLVPELAPEVCQRLCLVVPSQRPEEAAARRRVGREIRALSVRLRPIAEAGEIRLGRLVIALVASEVGEQMAPIHAGHLAPALARVACGRPRLVEAPE